MIRRSMLITLAVTATALSALSARSAPTPEAKIARVWHGRTPNNKADEYAAYVSESIKKFKTIPGNKGYQMFRETVGAETHFMVISYWSSRDAIHGYAGADISKTRPLPKDGDFLIEAEATVKNYEIVVRAD